MKRREGVQHLVIDFASKLRSSIMANFLPLSDAKLNQKLSHFTGFLEGKRTSLMREIRLALIEYIKRFYFPELTLYGHHVLFTFMKYHEGISTHPGCPDRIIPQIMPFIFDDKHEFVEGCYGEKRQIGNGATAGSEQQLRIQEGTAVEKRVPYPLSKPRISRYL